MPKRTIKPNPWDDQIQVLLSLRRYRAHPLVIVSIEGRHGLGAMDSYHSDDIQPEDIHLELHSVLGPNVGTVASALIDDNWTGLLGLPKTPTAIEEGTIF